MDFWFHQSFDFQSRTRIVFGPGKIESIADLAKECGMTRILVVSDPGLVKAGHVERALNLLKAGGLEAECHTSVHQNPTSEDVDACVAQAKAFGIDGFVGLGGGSSLDTAKGCNFVLTNGGTMKDYWGYGKATKPLLPLIAIPTTAGTGSECQSYALIADKVTHQKMACGDPKAAARVALLDPELTLTQPSMVTADTGMDTLGHAVEAAVTLKGHSLSRMFAFQSFLLTHFNLPKVLENPMDLDARGGMQLGAALGGMAIESSMLGAAHSAANPLTAHFDVIHGQAVGIMLPKIVAFNAHDPRARAIYADLSRQAGLVNPSDNASHAVTRLIERLETLLRSAGFPYQLRDHGVQTSDLEKLSVEASHQWTAQFNPRPIGIEDFQAIYGQAL